jgi:hypothetical protein
MPTNIVARSLAFAANDVAPSTSSAAVRIVSTAASCGSARPAPHFLYGGCDIGLIAGKARDQHHGHAVLERTHRRPMPAMRHQERRATQDRVVRGVVEHDGVVGNGQLGQRNNAGGGGDDVNIKT